MSFPVKPGWSHDWDGDLLKVWVAHTVPYPTAFIEFERQPLPMLPPRGDALTASADRSALPWWWRDRPVRPGLSRS
jgi:hypothetical protein